MFSRIGGFPVPNLESRIGVRRTRCPSDKAGRLRDSLCICVGLPGGHPYPATDYTYYPEFSGEQLSGAIQDVLMKFCEDCYFVRILEKILGFLLRKEYHINIVLSMTFVVDKEYIL
jgi:hypothetical protein